MKKRFNWEKFSTKVHRWSNSISFWIVFIIILGLAIGLVISNDIRLTIFLFTMFFIMVTAEIIRDFDIKKFRELKNPLVAGLISGLLILLFTQIQNTQNKTMLIVAIVLLLLVSFRVFMKKL